MEDKAILSDAWARRSTNKCCSITQNGLNVKAADILAECRQLRMETRLSLPCNCLKMFPLHRQRQLSGRLTFILTTFIPNNRKHALKIYMLTSTSSKRSLIVFIYLRSLLSYAAPFWRLSRVSTPASHKAPARSAWVVGFGCSNKRFYPRKGQRSKCIKRKYWEGKIKKISKPGMGGPWKWLQALRVDFRTPAK